MNAHIVTVSATAPANAALMRTLIDANGQQAATFNDRVRAAIAAKQSAEIRNATKAGA